MAGPLGVVTYFAATAFHPGHDPGHLKVVLPEYAADANWLAVHLAQFAGIALSTVALVALACSLVQRRDRADSYAAASPADRPGVLLVADAVRHLEIGTTSFFELDLALTLTLLGWLPDGVAPPRRAGVRGDR